MPKIEAAWDAGWAPNRLGVDAAPPNSDVEAAGWAPNVLAELAPNAEVLELPNPCPKPVCVAPKPPPGGLPPNTDPACQRISIQCNDVPTGSW